MDFAARQGALQPLRRAVLTNSTDLDQQAIICPNGLNTTIFPRDFSNITQVCVYQDTSSIIPSALYIMAPNPSEYLLIDNVSNM
jgi:hypothetical protein